jgi:hypothetical protein
MAKSILVVHDTTEFVFSGERSGLGHSNKKGKAAFLGHCSLAVAADEGTPLGVLRMHTWVRDSITPTALRKAGLLTQAQARKLPSEMDRWLQAVEQTSSLFTDPSKLIHVCDSEGDDYALLSGMTQKFRFVVRGCYDRKLCDDQAKLRKKLDASLAIVQRTVRLKKRIKKTRTEEKRKQPREEREATLAIHAETVRLSKPKSTPSELPASLPINVVYVREIDAPLDFEPVEWILYTTEPIKSEKDILKIVDYYRSRWVIEEYFKALKTGCAYEKRQLESMKTLLTSLMLLIPVAWLMLHMRSLSRKPETIPAELILPEPFLTVLRGHTEKNILTAQEALYSLAALGGHIKHNGPPGWLVLWRGYRELATMVQGYFVAQTIFSTLSRKRQKKM